MDLGLSGRGALVTGGRSGIGAAVVATLAREGCDVAIVDLAHDEEGERALASVDEAGRRALMIEADVRDFEAARRAVAETEEAFGELTILVCCAGISRDAMSWKMTVDQWDEVIGVNLTGTFNYNRAAAERLRNGSWGRIVNVASINGLRGKLGLANYSASKGGVIALTRTMARELGRYGVTANSIAPGFVRTPLTADLPAEVLAKAERETTVGRLGEPEDCADLVAFLCSERARHVTGEVIRIDGGQCA
ncbi:MAG TPA: SDR family NAD(P)-dependent oxidoreductase [Gemmatimonadota bacterium]|nr:SDR family NAD(P)-dependent oxidoreductase [Gemmatimonadota bacterium]